MKLLHHGILYVFLYSLPFLYPPLSHSATYFIDSVTGSDSNTGISESSAWKTMAKVNESKFNPGDQILLCRGKIWREPLIVPSSGASGNPIIIGAFGNGDNPTITTSLNKSRSIDWTLDSNRANVWYASGFPSDVGSILVNGNMVLAEKKFSKDTVVSQGQFYFESSSGIVYLSSASNPAAYYSGGIECWYNGSTASNGNILYLSGKNFVQINNLEIKYGGGHGIQITKCSDITIANNIISYVGGSYLSGMTRYGNGIEIWGAASNVTIQNNSVSQTFDEGLSTQYDSAISLNNITFQDNSIEKCGRGISSSSFGNPGASISGIYWRRNSITNSGLGWATPEIANCEGKGAQLNLTDTNATILNAYFTDNVIRNTASGKDPMGQGVLVVGGSWVIARNWIENTNNGAIRIYANASGILTKNIVVNSNRGQALFITENSGNLKIYNNTFIKTNSISPTIVELDGSGYPTSNIDFKNNILADLSGSSNQAMIGIYDPRSSVSLATNLYYASGGPATNRWKGLSCASKVDWEAKSGESNSVWGDPKFLSPSANDYRLQPTSIAIDSGSDVSTGQDAGNPIYGNPDIGAYETNLSAPTPKSLRVVSPKPN